MKTLITILAILMLVLTACQTTAPAEEAAMEDTTDEGAMEEGAMEEKDSMEDHAMEDNAMDDSMEEGAMEEKDSMDDKMAMEDENVAVEVGTDEEGNIEAEVEIKDEEGAMMEAPPINEWCEEGATYDLATEETAVNAVIEGVATYKGEEFCKGVHTMDIQGNEITTTYYFTYKGEEMWVISNVNGQEVETHIMN